MDGDLYESLKLELRRGSLTLGVLARLREERYGYTLRQALAQDGLEMEESTLYPLLRRLETQGLAQGVAVALLAQPGEHAERQRAAPQLQFQAFIKVAVHAVGLRVT